MRHTWSEKCLRGSRYPFVSGCLASSGQDGPRLLQGLPLLGETVQLPLGLIKLRLGHKCLMLLPRSCQMQHFLHNSDNCHRTLHHAHVLLKMRNSMSESQGKTDLQMGRHNRAPAHPDALASGH